jgi:hypothetical protein
MSGAGLVLPAVSGPGAPVRVAPVAYGAYVCPSASA